MRQPPGHSGVPSDSKVRWGYASTWGRGVFDGVVGGVEGVDAGTAFEIRSIDIADGDVGENIGAKLQTDQGEADLPIARARPEERRAAAVATEQENVPDIAKQRARFVEDEAEIPMA